LGREGLLTGHRNWEIARSRLETTHVSFIWRMLFLPIVASRSSSVTGAKATAEGRVISSEERNTMSEPLALLGGPKAVKEQLPTYFERRGRTFGTEEEELVLQALRSGCLTRHGGSMVKQLEKEFAAKLGVTTAVACSSGTAAVHLCVAALDPEPGDEFITSPITDIGSVVPVLWQNCVPVFADVDPRTMTLDPSDVERKITPRTRAIIAVHSAGVPADMESLRKLAEQHHLGLIEDCCQAYWAECGGKLVGTIGDVACFSLQQSKQITCGEGGLMVTSNAEYARRAVLFADKAWPREKKGLGAWRFLFLAQNYRMSELQGAVALAQLPKVEEVVRRRRERAEQLTRFLAEVPQILPPYVPEETKHSYWTYMLHVDETALGTTTDRFGEALQAEGVPAWVQYMVDPLYCSPVLAERKTYGASGYPFTVYGGQQYGPGLCPRAEQALKTAVAVYWNENYTEAQVGQIGAAIAKVAHYYARNRPAMLS
jgi:perosamine synthetase